MQEGSGSDLGSTRISLGAVWRRTRGDETGHRATGQEAGETGNGSHSLLGSVCSWLL